MHAPFPILPVRIIGCWNKRCQRVIMDKCTKCAYTGITPMLKHLYDYGIACISVLPLHAAYSK